MRTSGRNDACRLAISVVVAAVVAASTTGIVGAQVPPALKFVIGGLNAQLPLELGKNTSLIRLAADDDAVDAILEIEPGSPLALGIDVRSEAARLCRIDVIRKLTRLMKAKLRVSYVKPDQTPVGSFEIDRAICAQ